VPARFRMVTEGEHVATHLDRLTGELSGFCLVRRAAARTFLKSGAGKCMESVGIL